MPLKMVANLSFELQIAYSNASKATEINKFRRSFGGEFDTTLPSWISEENSRGHSTNVILPSSEQARKAKETKRKSIKKSSHDRKADDRTTNTDKRKRDDDTGQRRGEKKATKEDKDKPSKKNRSSSDKSEPRSSSNKSPQARKGGISELDSKNLSRLCSDLLTLVNKTRAKHGLHALKWNESLKKAAQHQTNHQARIRKMTHDGEGGMSLGKRVLKAGYDHRKAAENVAVGYQSAEDVFRAWMLSPGHRKNILERRVVEMGAYVCRGGGRWYWTQVFGVERGERGP